MKAAAAPAPPWPCLRVPPGEAERCVLLLVVVPNARSSAADGLFDGALRVRLAAPALEGRANEALLAWLAAQLDLPPRDLALARGVRSRRKAVRIAAAPARVQAWLRQALPEAARIYR